MHGLVAGDGAPSSPESPEMLTGADPELDGPVILFEDSLVGLSLEYKRRSISGA
jgi:hypothetical protein